MKVLRGILVLMLMVLVLAGCANPIAQLREKKGNRLYLEAVERVRSAQLAQSDLEEYDHYQQAVEKLQKVMEDETEIRTALKTGELPVGEYTYQQLVQLVETEGEARELYDQATQAVGPGRLAEALAKVERILREYPTSRVAVVLLQDQLLVGGYSLTGLRQAVGKEQGVELSPAEKMIEELDQLVTWAEKVKDVSAVQQLKFYQEANDLVERLIQEYPDDPSTRQLLENKLEIGSYTLRDFRGFYYPQAKVKLEPQEHLLELALLLRYSYRQYYYQPEWVADLAQELIESGQGNLVQELLPQIRDEVDQARVYLELGKMYYSEDQDDEAQEMLKVAEDKARGDVEILLAIADQYKIMHKNMALADLLSLTLEFVENTDSDKERVEWAIRIYEGDRYLEKAFYGVWTDEFHNLRIIVEVMENLDQFDPAPEWFIRIGLLAHHEKYPEGLAWALEEYFAYYQRQQAVASFEQWIEIAEEYGLSQYTDVVEDLLVQIREYVQGFSLDGEETDQEDLNGEELHQKSVAELKYAGILWMLGQEDEAVALARKVEEEFEEGYLDDHYGEDRIIALVMEELAQFYLEVGLLQDATRAIYNIEEVPDGAFDLGRLDSTFDTNVVRESLILKLVAANLRAGFRGEVLSISQVEMWNSYLRKSIFGQMNEYVGEFTETELASLVSQLEEEVLRQGGDETPEEVDGALLIYLAEAYLQLGESQRVEDLVMQILKLSPGWDEIRADQVLFRVDSLLRRGDLSLDGQAEELLQVFVERIRLNQ